MKHKFHLLTAVSVFTLLGSAAMAGGDKLQFSADDQDGNGALSQIELTSSIQKADVYGLIDKNDNGVLEEDEADNDLIEYDDEIDLDKNGSLNRNEFAIAVFDRFDDNDDNRLDADEYDSYSEQVAEVLES